MGLERCADERELRYKRGAACLRMRDTSTSMGQAWINEHKKSAQRFLAEVVAWQRPKFPTWSIDEEPLQSRWAAHCEVCTQQEDESRFRCLICSKLFKGVKYIQKHILKVHPQGLEPLYKELNIEQMRNLYMDAKTGPGWK